jgi:hypothetical protein
LALLASKLFSVRALTPTEPNAVAESAIPLAPRAEILINDLLELFIFS